MKKLYEILLPLLCLALLCSCGTVNTTNQADNSNPSSGFSFSFDGNFNNNIQNGIFLSNYGTLEFSDNSISGKSILYSNGYLEIGQSEKIIIHDCFSFSVWFKITDLNGCIDPIFFGKASSSGDVESGPLSVHFSDNYSCLRTELTFICADDSYKSHSFSSDHAFDRENIVNSWNNITIVFDKELLTYYLNGEKLNEERIPQNIRGYKTIASNNNPYFIGRGAIGEYCGYLDEIMLTTNVLDETEISDMYTKGISKFTNELIIDANENKIYSGKREFISDIALKNNDNGNLLLPVRPVIENLGGQLHFEEFDGYGRTDISIGDLKSSVWIMDTNAVVNDKHIKLSSYPVFIDDIFYISLDYFSQKLGIDIKYDSLSNEYILKY